MKAFLWLVLLLGPVVLFSQTKVYLWGENASKGQRWTQLYIYKAENQDSSGISVIICPGGSYIYLDRFNEGISVAKWFNRRGITAFVLRYRTAWEKNRHPAMIEDLQCAIKYVRENAEKYEINPHRIGVLGFSAGGHLAGMSSIYFDTVFLPEKPRVSLRPAFVAMIYPVVSMEDGICHEKSRRNILGDTFQKEEKDFLSLEKNVHCNVPPVFLLHCTGDRTVNYGNSVLFDQALTSQNVKHEFLLLEESGKGGHGFGIRPNGKATGWIEHFTNWVLSLCSDSII